MTAKSTKSTITYAARNSDGMHVSTHRSEAAATRAARKIGGVVTMDVVSGEYSSRTQVYPTLGVTYSL